MSDFLGGNVPRCRVASLLFALTIPVMTATAQAALVPERLRCEYKVAPLAIDTPHPRLFWAVASPERGERQTAYRVLAASSLEALSQNRGDLWDTGKVASKETIQIPYTGKSLRSGQQVFWKVRVWDATGKPSDWSRSATWTMGLLQPSDWSAQWIGPPTAHAATEKPTLDNAKWIWFAGDGEKVPIVKRYFYGMVDLPGDAQIKSASLSIAADDRAEISINGEAPHPDRKITTWREYRTFDISSELHPGSNRIALQVENTEEGPAGLIARVVVHTVDGQEFVRVTDGTWEAAATSGGQSLGPAHVIGPNGVQPWGKIPPHENYVLTPPPYFRKSFTAKRGIRRALLYATALGVYRLSLNGERVDNDVLSPGWTDYHYRVHYLAYDVTKLLHPGANTIGAILGDGWYASYLAFTGKRHYYGGDTQLRLQLAIDYTDGSHETVGTDATWKTRTGAILSADNLMGSTIDTRREMPGWDTPGFATADWQPVAVQPAPKLIVESQPNEPIRPTGQIVAQSRTEPHKGVFIYDMGQNMVGWVRLTVDGKPGQKIIVRHAERLNPDGTIYTTNLCAARATDTYILKGGKQTLEPIFTFHGFQYVEISGDAAPLSPHAVVGIPASSDLQPTLAFDSDNPLLNRLTRNIDWGFRGNSLDVPTDCPQRDERAGWMADAQVFTKTAMFHRDAGAFYTKWLTDVRDGQFPDGSYSDVAPSFIGGGNAAWEDAGVICPYRLYEMYGDTRIIEESWPSLQKFMDHLAKVAPDGIRPAGAYGDWLLLAGPGYSPIHGTAYYYRCASLMATMAQAIGHQEDAQKYRTLSLMIRDAFNTKFVSPDGKVTDNGQESQTFYALALEWDLIADDKRALAAQNLSDLIQKQGGHLTTGFIGTPLLLQSLASVGRADTANHILLLDTYPSWLYQVKIGATTMWERWDGWTPEKGFQNPGMNSFNHYWLGCVGEWIYSGVGGIDTQSAAWSRIVVHPHPEGVLKHVRVRYDSIRGPVISEWKKTPGGQFTFGVTIPANTTATVYVPAKSRAAIRESGKSVTQAPGVTFVRQEANDTVFAVQSGHYNFQVNSLP